MVEEPGGAGVPEVTIVIVSYNTRDLLERCLQTASASSPEIPREVRVIDNASADGSAEAVASHWPEVVLTRNRENRGYAPACNQGLAAARGRYVLALNSDALLRGDALAALIRCLEAYPGAAAVEPRLLNADGSTQWACARRAPRFLPSLVGHTQLPAYFPGLLPFVRGTYPPAWYAHAGEADVLSGACILIRREALEQVGLLDERLVLNYDDVEWCMRARRRGYRLRYEPEAEVTHLGGASRAFDAETMSVANFRSIGAFWDLAYRRPAAAVLKFVLVVSVGLSLLKNVLLAPFVARSRMRAAHLLVLVRHCVAMLVRPVRTP
jgi:GT2 family glycosyltransferase